MLCILVKASGSDGLCDLRAFFVVLRPVGLASDFLKILIPVGTAIIIVGDVQCAGVSASVPTVNM